MKKDTESREFLIDMIEKSIPDKFKNYSDLSKKSGVPQSSISEYISGKTKSMHFESAFQIMKSIAYSQNISIIKRIAINAPLEELDEANQDLVEINIYATAGAGQAWDLIEDEPIKTIRIPQNYMEQVDFALSVEGDSMHPTVKHGAVVGIRQDFNYTQSEVYAIRLPYEGLSIKRVSKDHVKNAYIVRSDSYDQQKYPPYEIPMQDNDNFIVGRVMWVWQNI